MRKCHRIGKRTFRSTGRFGLRSLCVVRGGLSRVLSCLKIQTRNLSCPRASTVLRSHGLLKVNPVLKTPASMFFDTSEINESGASAQRRADWIRSLSCVSKENKNSHSQRRIFLLRIITVHLPRRWECLTPSSLHKTHRKPLSPSRRGRQGSHGQTTPNAPHR